MQHSSYAHPAISFSPALLQEARQLKDQKNYSEAFYRYQLLCLTNPSDHGLMLEWAQCKLYCGMEKEAVAEFKLLIDLEPRWHEPDAWLATYYASRKDFRSAYHYIRQAIRLSGFKQAAYMNEASRYALALNKPMEAFHLIQAALELEPANALFYYTKALLAYAGENYQGALTDLDMAIELHPYYKEAFLLRSECKRHLLDERGAYEDRSQAMSLGDEETSVLS